MPLGSEQFAFGKTKYAVINASADAQTALVAAVSGSKIRVLAFALTQSAAGSLKFESASTALTGTIEVLADTPFVCPFAQSGWFETVAGEALNMTTVTGAVQGFLTYIEIDTDG